MNLQKWNNLLLTTKAFSSDSLWGRYPLFIHSQQIADEIKLYQAKFDQILAQQVLANQQMAASEDALDKKVKADVQAEIDLYTELSKAVSTAYGAKATNLVSTPKSIPKMAEGGIVSSPTIAMIGEAGAEAVVPLNKMGSMSGVTVHVNVYGDVSGDELVNKVEQVLIDRLKFSTATV